MYAIIEDSGAQRKVVEGEEILIDLVNGGEIEAGTGVTFDRVLVIGGRDGGKTALGQPYVAGATVVAEVLEPVVMGEKLEIQKFRTKKNYRRHTGHRQRYTKVKVTGIKG
jgi:large subunit ribosomal protein L21